MERVAVFGATGTIGAYTALHLKNLGYEVIAVGRRKCDNGFFQEFGIPYYSVDISKESSFDVLPSQDLAHIIHCAGSMPGHMEGYYPRQCVDSIVTGTLNVLDYCVAVKADRIVFTHTHSDSIHLQGSKEPIPADIIRGFPPTGDHAVYAICKNAAVDLIEHYYHEFGIKRFVLRLPTIYAYHPDPYFYVDGRKTKMAYRLLMDQAMRSEPIEIWGDPTREKEIVYVKDLLQIIERCLDAAVDGGVYNVGRGVGVSLERQIRGIVQVFSPPDNPSRVTYSPEKPDGRQFVHDITKTRVELGYTPQYDYQALLLDFKEEMEANPFRRLWGDPLT